MSDIQELIYKVSMDCIEKGKRDEKERIIKLLEDDYWHHLSYFPRLVTDKPKLEHHKECLGCQLIALIKGEK